MGDYFFAWEALYAPFGGTSPKGGGKGRWGPLSPSLAPPVGELSAKLTEREKAPLLAEGRSFWRLPSQCSDRGLIT